MKKYTVIAMLALGIFILSGCGGASNTQSTATPVSTQPATSSTEQPVPVSSGAQIIGSDIPDTQAFATYTSSQGKYQLVVPEGWAQSASGTDVSFVSNLDGLQIAFASATTQPTASSARA